MKIQRLQTPPFVARISVSATGAIIDPTEIESITYSINRIETGLISLSRTAVENHQDVSVPLTSLLESPVYDSLWEGIQPAPTIADGETPLATDSGYNFKHEPNTRTNAAFSECGTYEVFYRLLPVIGNPIILRWNVVVE